MRTAKFRVDQNAAQRAKLEKQIESARETILQSARELSEATSNAAREKNRDRFNEFVAQQDAARSRRLQAERYCDSLIRQLNKLGDPRDDYVTLLLNVSANMEKMAEQYANLADDREVRDALAAINAGGGLKVRLGPSSRFAEELPAVRKQRDLLKDAVIKFEAENGTPKVRVTLNEKLNLLMTFDSGASSVTLTSEAAKELGLQPGPNDPVAEATGADGNKTKVQVVMLKSVRLGQFNIGDVECLIFPPSVKGANLLGGSFLRNFVYRMDLAAGEIHMTQVGGKVVVPQVPDVEKNAARAKPPGHERALVLEIKAEIDGSDTVTVTPAGLAWSHKDWQWPSAVQVNGLDWNPKKETILPSNGPLAFLRQVDFSAAKLLDQSGRGSITMKPTDAGLEIHFVDGPNGASEYGIQISLPRK
jgi:clan AA aspartic protease (TIGR02281 family)